MTINSNRLFQLFKYSVYTLLAINIFVFWHEEVLAAAIQFPNGVPLSLIIGFFPSSIDTAAWVVLLLMFELETYVLEDHHYTPKVTWSLQGIRVLCYAFIVYAFYGYAVKLDFIYQATPIANVADLCTLITDGWSYATDLDEYTLLTAANCSSLPATGEMFRFANMNALVDAAGLQDIRNLAWVDVINAAAWLLVVLVLELDVRLQDDNRYEGLPLRASYAAKLILYPLLILAAIFWGFKGDFVDFWDAFLWIVAFAFIELNIFEWSQESRTTQTRVPATPTSS